ncbi:hypothetical protein C8R42DRAFT_439398 [Lentinula raphanica]|nr:hypothetical protein C8R42DRAFT_439398 [Lentinula raphanica]
MGIFQESHEEQALQAHIRQLLYDYAKEHLTTSYVEFTEQAVAELLSEALHVIPTVDNSSVRLPEEPFTTLSRLYALHELKPYDEESRNASEVMRYLKTFLTTLRNGEGEGYQLRSERAVSFDDYGCEAEERYQSMLSRRATRETPRPGSNDSRQSLNTTYSSFLQSTKVKIRPVEQEILQEPQVTLDKVLNTTWSLPHETGVQVRNFLRDTTAALSFPNSSYQNRYLDPSTRPNSPPVKADLAHSSFFDEETVIFEPIFSRKQRPRCGRAEAGDERQKKKEEELGKGQEAVKRRLVGTIGPGKGVVEVDNATVNAGVDAGDGLLTLDAPLPRSIAQVAPILSLAPVDENDGVDLSRENMKIIDGWQTYHSSSPIPHASQASGSSSLTSVTTPCSSQEIDELHSQNIIVSSPNTELVSPIEVLKESRMELPALPRSKRNVFGDRTSMTMKSKRIGAKQSYSAFLLDTLTNTKGKPLLSKDIPKQRLMLPLPTHMKKSKQETHIANESCSHSALHNVAAMRSSPIMDFDEPALTMTRTEDQPRPRDEAESDSNVDLNNEEGSLAGQVGSSVIHGLALNGSAEGGTKDGKDVADIDLFESELQAIFQSVDTESPLDMILREKLDLRRDGKEMFMEVPTLLPPNQHPPNDPHDVHRRETSLRRFVVPSPGAIKGGKGKDENKTYHQFLKKAKGIASLTLELSWVPFSTQTTALPTHTELLALDEFIDGQNTGVLNSFERLGMSKAQGLEKVGRMIERATGIKAEAEDLGGGTDKSSGDPAPTIDRGPSQIEEIFERWSRRADEVMSTMVFYPEGKLEIALSREERRRVKGLAMGEAGEVERVVEGDGLVDEAQDCSSGVEHANADVLAGQETAVKDSTINPRHLTMEEHQLKLPSSSPSSLRPVPHSNDGSAPQAFALTPDPTGMLSPVYDAELFPRAETGFGIPYHLLDSLNGIEYQGDHHHGWLLGEDDFEPLRVAGSVAAAEGVEGLDQYGNGFGDEDGFDSDKENQDPSDVLLHLRAQMERKSLEDHCDYLLDQPAHHSPDYQHDDEASYNRPTKRPRLDWDEEYRYQDPGDLPEVNDSGIGFVDYLLCPGPDGPLPSEACNDDATGTQAHAHLENQEELTVFDPNHQLHSTKTATTQYHQDPDFVPLTFESQPILVPQGTHSQLQPLSPAPVHPVQESQPPAPSEPFKIPVYDHSVNVAEFARLRSKKLRTPPPAKPEPVAPAARAAESESSNGSLAHKIAPESIFDKNTLRLPDLGDRTLPTTAHWYMASMNLLQKQALVRSLRSGACGIGLVERDTLVAVDLIIDPHTAVIFTNLLALPSQVDALVDSILEQSWRYDNLLVIFEAFVPSMAFKLDSATKATSSASASSSLNAYSPPVIKAVRKFRRDMSLKEACGDKREGCRVMNAFADTVQDAAMLARMFGDEAEKRSGTEVGLWGDRAWLDDEGGEDEDNLAAADGMNHFSACVILCQISLDDLLKMDPEERVARFAPHVGHDRMLTLNGVIDHGRQTVQDVNEANFAG